VLNTKKPISLISLSGEDSRQILPWEQTERVLEDLR